LNGNPDRGRIQFSCYLIVHIAINHLRVENFGLLVVFLEEETHVQTLVEVVLLVFGFAAGSLFN